MLKSVYQTSREYDVLPRNVFLSSVISFAICLFWQVIAKTLTLRVACDFIRISVCSEFRKSANDRLDFKFYLLLQERVRALLDANIYAEILIHLFKRRKVERAQVKQIRTRGCFNRGHASINMTKTLKCR